MTNIIVYLTTNSVKDIMYHCWNIDIPALLKCGTTEIIFVHNWKQNNINIPVSITSTDTNYFLYSKALKQLHIYTTMYPYNKTKISDFIDENNV